MPSAEQSEGSSTFREPVRCARPGCPSVFIPKHKEHKFCSPTCKRRAHAYRHVLNLPRRN